MREQALDYEEAVLEIVALIPAGRVLTYGDIAEALETGGPRQIGAVMSRGSTDVPWWRVLRADGRPPRGLEDAAVAHYLRESTVLRPVSFRSGGAGGSTAFRVHLPEARWIPTLVEQAKLQAIRTALARGKPIPSATSPGMSEADGGLET